MKKRIKYIFTIGLACVLTMCTGIGVVLKHRSDVSGNLVNVADKWVDFQTLIPSATIELPNSSHSSHGFTCTGLAWNRDQKTFFGGIWKRTAG